MLVDSYDQCYDFKILNIPHKMSNYLNKYLRTTFPITLRGIKKRLYH